ncbi:MAG: DoxX family membrane protein [Natronosporangium sp.]
MDVVILIGRILFVVLMLGSAWNHFSQAKGMTEYAQSKGVPMPGPAVLGGGVLLALGGLSVLLGIWPDLGALLLVLFLLPTAVLMHGFWRESDPQARQAEMIQFMKDLSLGGAALMLLGLFATAGDEVGLTITGPLF